MVDCLSDVIWVVFKVCGLKCLKEASKYPKGFGVAWSHALRLQESGTVLDLSASEMNKVIDAVFMTKVMPHIARAQPR